MSIIDKLKSLELDEGTVVTLMYEEGTDVFVHNETEVETALSETDVVSTFSELIATPGLKASTQYGGEVLEMLRCEGLLEDYKRDGYFSDYLTETIADNFYDIDFIDHSTEKYDHKRGFCTLTAKVQVSVDNLISSSPFLSGWTVSVKTDSGTLVMD
jgi:hypothetical protein